MSSFFSLSLFFCFVLVMGSASVPTQHLILVGGGLSDSNLQVFSRIVQLASGAGNAKIGVITAGSMYPKESYDSYVEPFEVAGAASVTWIPIDYNHTEAVSDPSVLNLIAQQTGFFFAGGDQTLIKSIFAPKGVSSPALQLIAKMWKLQGVPVAGSSAGADIQQGPPMIAGGESWEALIYGAFNESAAPSDLKQALLYDPDGGFGFFSFGLVDTHVDTRGRVGRNLALLHAANRSLAFCIDENTALEVLITRDRHKFTVLGASGVSILDLSNASWRNLVESKTKDLSLPPPLPFSAKGILYHYLTQQDEISYQSGNNVPTITIPSWKPSLRGREKYPSVLPTAQDIFSSESDRRGRLHPRQFILTAQTLVNSLANVTRGFSYEKSPYQVRVEFIGGSGFSGKLANDTTDLISVVGMTLNMATSSSNN